MNERVGLRGLHAPVTDCSWCSRASTPLDFRGDLADRAAIPPPTPPGGATRQVNGTYASRPPFRPDALCSARRTAARPVLERAAVRQRISLRRELLGGLAGGSAMPGGSPDSRFRGHAIQPELRSEVHVFSAGAIRTFIRRGAGRKPTTLKEIKTMGGAVSNEHESIHDAEALG